MNFGSELPRQQKEWMKPTMFQKRLGHSERRLPLAVAKGERKVIKGM